MKIVIGSTNPAKVHAVEQVFSGLGEIKSYSVPSGVNEQPFSDEETIRGAIGRAQNALRETAADLSIGLEGGVTETPFGLMLCNWGALIDRSTPSIPLIAGGARIVLPEEVARRLRNGEELGPVMDEYSRKKNVRSHEGAVGIFTNGAVSRENMYAHVLLLLKGQWEYHKKKRSF
jgi:Protein of unknown function DUF84.